MLRVNGYPIFDLGQSLGNLRGRLHSQETGRADARLSVQIAHDNLARFLEGDALPLRVIQQSGRALLATIAKLADVDRVLTDGEWRLAADGLHWDLVEFDRILRAEFPDAPLFYVSRKRAWDMSTLIESGEMALSLATLTELSVPAIRDLREAAKCIAFEVPVAASIHTHRAIESAVRLYFPIIGFVPKESDRNLGRYIKEMMTAGVDQKITAMLTHLKDEYRNPVMHPEHFPSPSEAENLFGFAHSVIDAMVTDVVKMRAAKGVA